VRDRRDVGVQPRINRIRYTAARDASLQPGPMLNVQRLRLATAACVMMVCLASAMPVAASGGNGGNNNNNNGNSGNGNNPPSLATTPELDSLALFGTGAAGMAGYALMRLNARRRRDDSD
jgi:hypothetical protein